MKSTKSVLLKFELLLVVIFVAIVILPVSCSIFLGVGGFGPKEGHENVTIKSKHLDSQENSYMLVTDKGVFEVGNGFLLGMWNADEVYGEIEVGSIYNLETKGNKVLSWYVQAYPYVVEYRKLDHD
jgi:hypothetical protein